MQAQRVKSIKKLGIQNVLDIEVDHPDHNFYAEGIVTSNSHAVGYSYITAQTAYLKANHPKEFFLSLLKMSKFEPNPIEVISKTNQELRFFGIQLLPPHILNSDIDFKIVGNDIMFGLGSIKGISDKTIERLNKFRCPHPTKFDIFLGAKEAGLSIGVTAALILVGAIGNEKRSKLVYEAQLFNLLTQKEKRFVVEHGPQFNYDLVKCLKHLKVSKDEKGKPLMKESRYVTLKKHEEPYRKMLEFNSKYEELSRYYFERLLLGYAYSTTLMSIYKPSVPDLITIEEANTCLAQEKVRIVGEVTNVINRKGKESGRRYIKIDMQDHTGSCQVLLCDSDTVWKIEEHKEENGRIVKEGDLVVVSGSKGDNIIFGKKIGIQECSILSKISQIKEIKEPENNEKVEEKTCVQTNIPLI